MNAGLLVGAAAAALPLDRLRTMVFFLVDRCNAKCPYCFNTRLDHLENHVPVAGRELTLEEYAVLARNLRGLNQAIFSGGEPFLHPDIDRIAGLLHREAGARLFSIPTNGALPERVLPKVEAMAAACPGAVFNLQVSLDAVGEKHEAMRRLPGGFAKAVRLGHDLLDLGERLRNVNFVVNTAVLAENLADVRELRAFLKTEFGGRLKYHNLQYDQRLGREVDALEEDEPASGGGLFEAAVRRLYIRGVNGVIRRQLAEDRMVYACNAGRKLGVILPTAEFSPCEPFVFEPRYKDFPTLDLRAHGLDPYAAMRTPEWERMLRFIRAKKCAACPWTCAAISSLFYEPVNWPQLLRGGPA